MQLCGVRNDDEQRDRRSRPLLLHTDNRNTSILLCFVSPGVNLLVGTENGLKLLDRSGQGKVYPLINSRRFQQMDVLEGLNLLITISGQSGRQVLKPRFQDLDVRLIESLNSLRHYLKKINIYYIYFG